MTVLYTLLILFFSPQTSEKTVQNQSYSTVSGKIELPKALFRKKVKRRRRRSRSYGRRVKNLQKKAKKYTEYEKSIVYLKPLDPKNNVLIKREAVLKQHFISFEPAHLVVQKGNRVTFVNEDNLFHNVFSSCCTEKFNIGKKRTGVQAYETFYEESHMQVFCDIHADMSALISVVDTPYFTTCDAKGNFKIDNIPPGDYIVYGWHTNAKYESGTITIKPSKHLKVKLQFN